MRHNCFFLFLISFSILAHAQSDFRSGYVLLNNSDTLHGLLDYRSEKFNAQQCNFKADSNSAVITYYPKDIYGYRINDSKYYRTRNVVIDSVEKSLFLELLVDGIADLYYTHPGIYFIESEERGMQILENTSEIITYNKMNYEKQTPDDANGIGSKYYRNKHEYIAFLKIYFQDQVALWDDIEQADFSHKDLINITTEYHNMVCPDEECIVYSKSDFSFKLRLNLIAGITSKSIEMYSFNKYRKILSAPYTSGLTFGIELEPYRTGTYRRFYPKISVLYSQDRFKNHEIAEDPFSIEFNTLNFGLSFNYIYSKYRLKPFGGIGILHSRSNDNGNSWLHIPANSFNASRMSFGACVSAGISFKLNELLGLILESDYCRQISGYNKDQLYFMEIQKFDVRAGLVFFLVQKN